MRALFVWVLYVAGGTEQPVPAAMLSVLPRRSVRE